MNKKILNLGMLTSMAVPIVAVVSCATSLGGENKKFVAPIHEYIFDKKIQDSDRRAHLDLTHLSWERLTQLSPDLGALYIKDIVATGFGEKRAYYISGTSKIYHAGIDVMRPEGETILAPFDAEVIGQYWYNEEAAFANGIGGVILLRTKISDMHIKPDYKKMIYIKESSGDHPKVWSVPKMAFINSGKFIAPSGHSKVRIATITEYKEYLKTISHAEVVKQQSQEEYINVSFMHLSKSSVLVFKGRKTYKDVNHIAKPRLWHGKLYNLNKHVRYNTSIDYSHRLRIKRGDKIGYIGNIHENGGWEPHVHIEALYFSPSNHTWGKFRDGKISKYSTVNPANSLTIRSWTNIHPEGTVSAKIVESHGATWLNRQHNSSSIDPNNIFQFYTEETPTIVV